jgi:hypothetical protein
VGPFLLLVVFLGVAFFGLLIYALPFAAVLAVLRWSARHVRRLNAYHVGRPLLSEAARKLRLVKRRSSRLLGDGAGGNIEGFAVTLEQHWRTIEQRTTDLRITVKLDEPLAHRLALFSRTSPPETLPLGEPVRTCDPTFDALFAVHGRSAAVAALLDSSVRRRLVELQQECEVFAQGDTAIAYVSSSGHHDGTLSHVVFRLVTIVRDLTAQGPELPARLLSNAVSDPLVAVRYQNLDLLLRDYATSAEAKEGLRVAWQAPERGIRYLAAIRMGGEAYGFLEETVDDSAELPPLRLMALRHLARHAPRERVLPLLERSLRDPAPGVREATIELYGRLQEPSAITQLAEIARRTSSKSTCLAVAQALGNIGHTSAEPVLLELLEDGDLETQIAAATALGRCGTGQSIARLERVATRYFTVRDLSTAARAAIGRIVSRVGRPERGRLSVTEIDQLEGALSAPEGAGAISITDPPGTLSVSEPAAGEASSSASRTR